MTANLNKISQEDQEAIVFHAKEILKNLDAL